MTRQLTRRLVTTAVGAFAAAFAMLSASSAGEAHAQDAAPDLTLRAPPPPRTATRAAGGGRRGAAGGRPAGDVPWGFYRDRQGRVMQVSFDFGRRLWLGVGYAPHRTPAGRHRDLAGGVRLRRHLRRAVGDGRTRRRFTVLDGQVRLHSIRAGRHRVPLRPVPPLRASAAAHHDLRQGAGAARPLPERRPLHRGAALRDGAARDRGRAVADASPPCRRRWTCGSRRTCGRTCACGPGPASRCGSGRGRRRRATSASFRRRRWRGT